MVPAENDLLDDLSVWLKLGNEIGTVFSRKETINEFPVENKLKQTDQPGEKKTHRGQQRDFEMQKAHTGEIDQRAEL